MSRAETVARLAEYRRRIDDLRRQMRAERAAAEPEEVADYEFATPEGPARLSSLFGTKDDLILIHNMGSTCPNCTLWADGYNGVYPHLIDRAAFVVASPDSPEMQRAFAETRGWRFRMVSHRGTSFAADMGYRSAKGTWLPGISVFRREDGRVLRVADTPCDIGDDFCALWHLLDLLPEGRAGFRPKLSYG